MLSKMVLRKSFRLLSLLIEDSIAVVVAVDGVDVDADCDDGDDVVVEVDDDRALVVGVVVVVVVDDEGAGNDADVDDGMDVCEMHADGIDAEYGDGEDDEDDRQ